jgi:serine/threonine protein kinase
MDYVEEQTAELELDERLAFTDVMARLTGASRPPVRLDRFEILRRLGRGGMGVVYEAFDCSWGSRVALKTMSRLGGIGAQRLKHEFRALSGIHHPNLIVLHELFGENSGQWFFTMELVNGLPFDRWTRLADAETRDEQLRSALKQLASAIGALHAAGKLHRDLKPGNVLVTSEGRVVVLDFGLASDLLVDTGGSSLREVVGTPAYMAPELVGGGEPHPASDWYAMGVMLFQALTGRLPFADRSLRGLGAPKAYAHSRAVCASVPQPWTDLCVRLLNPEAKERPSGADILKILGDDSASAPTTSLAANRSQPITGASVFVGRQTHLASLDRALQAAAAGGTIRLFVRGGSGVGKTELLEHFIAARGDDVLVLRGRCYEQESIPHKALDGVVDALNRRLRAMPQEEAVSLLPPKLGELVQLFPILRYLEAMVPRSSNTSGLGDAHERRRVAFEAFKELLRNVAKKTSILMVVDDLQWGDADSARLLNALMGAPRPPSLLFVGAYRTDEVETSSFLKLALEDQVLDQVGHLETLDVDPLDRGCAVELAKALAKQEALELPDDLATSIATESEGKPLFIAELVQQLKTRRASLLEAPAAVSLDEVMLGRVRSMPPEAQRGIEILSVAGSPLEQAVALKAAELPPDGRTIFPILRTARLVRTRAGGTAEPSHDRIRDVVIASLLPDQLHAMHARLARALEAERNVDPERLLKHYIGCAEFPRAGLTALRAARAAAVKLAFNHAAKLFETSIKFLPAQEIAKHEIFRHLGDALANAGRGAQAALAYLQAAEGNHHPQRQSLQRAAAQQYVRSGRVKEATALMRTLLAQNGMRWPETGLEAVAAVLWNKAALALRGYEYSVTREEHVAPATLDKLDVLLAVFRELGSTDVLRGAVLQGLFLREALAAGEPTRLLIGLAWEAYNSALLAGTRAYKKATHLLALVDGLARHIDTPYAMATAKMAHAGCIYFWARFDESLPLAQEADAIFRGKCTGTFWEQQLATTFRLGCVEWTGGLANISDDAPDLARQAFERDDRFSQGYLALPFAAAKLMADDPKSALVLLDQQRWWLEADFTATSVWVLHRTIDTYNYMGRGSQALEFHMRHWKRFKTSYVYRAKPFYVLAHWFRVKSAIGAAVELGTSAPLSAAEKATHALERTKRTDALCLSLLGRASIARLQQNDDGAHRCLLRAIDVGRRHQTGLLAIYAERNLGVLLGGAQGTKLVDEADAKLRGQSVRNPERWVATYAPGFTRLEPAASMGREGSSQC